MADERFKVDMRQWPTAIAAHATAISARLEDITTRQREAETRQRDAEARQGEAETRQRDAEARNRESETRQREVEAWQRDAETRATLKVRVHELLQSTTDPYLSFYEIRQALGPALPASALAPPELTPAATPDLVAASDLRRALIELVGQSVIAQLDRDRYFIASDFEDGDGES